MNLVKIGNRYINLDLVYQISFNDKQREQFPETTLQAELDVAFPVSMYSDGVEDGDNPLEAAGMRVFGQEAEALRHLLDRWAADAGQVYQQHLQSEQMDADYKAWVVQVTAFVEEHGGDKEEASSYRSWLADRHSALENPEPTEESFAEFREGPVVIPF